MMQNYGMTNIRSVASASVIIANKIKPLMELDGFRFVSNREFPELMAYINQKKIEMGFNNNMSINIVATEWINRI